ncbi:MAG: peptidoglycan-binding domain-containing protein [Candidatus Paceibacterota bacterium]
MKKFIVSLFVPIAVLTMVSLADLPTVVKAENLNTAVITVDTTSPLSSALSSNSDGLIEKEIVLVFGIKNTSTNIGILRSVTVNFSSTPGSITTAYLYQGEKLVGAAPIVSGEAAFSMNSSVSGAAIPYGVYVPYIVRVDGRVTNATGVKTETSIKTGGITMETFTGASFIVSGSITGSPITFVKGDSLSSTPGTISGVRPSDRPTAVGNTSPVSSCYTFTKNFGIGTNGVDVVALQNWLINNGYSIPLITNGGVAKGYFGSATSDVVKNFQKAVGIEFTGYIGENTRAYLNRCSTSGNVPELQVSSGITVTLPQPNDTVTLPITVGGYVNGNGWSIFEGEVGSAQVFDSAGNPISAVSNLAVSSGSSLKLPAYFQGSVGDRQYMSYINTNTGYIKITSTGAKDGTVLKTVTVPVKFGTVYPSPITNPTPTPSSSPVATACYRFSSNFGLGSEGSDVSALQSFLISKGFDISAISSGQVAKGYFGPSTQSAVVRYQNSLGITATGYVGTLTREYLNKCAGGAGSTIYYPNNTPSAVSASVPSISAPTVKITSPLGTVSWNQQSNVTWTWQTTSVIPSVDIYLLRGGDITLPFVKNYPNTGTYSWKVGAISSWNMNSLPNGDYTVTICPSGQQRYAETCGKFNINVIGTAYLPSPSASASPVSSVQPTISVIYPREGDKWTVGNTYRISWNKFTSNSDTFVYLNGGGNYEGYSKLIGSIIGTNTYMDYQVTSSDMPTAPGYSWKVAVCNGRLQNGGNNCGWSGQVYVSSVNTYSSPTVTPTASASPVPAPTATLTVQGTHNYSFNVGQTANYYWNSSNADTFSSTYTSTNAAMCGAGGAWSANTSSGYTSSLMTSNAAGCYWTVTYTARNSATGQSASDTITVKVNPTASPSASPSSSPSAYVDQDALTASIWASIKAYYEENI